MKQLRWVRISHNKDKRYQSIGREFIYDIEDTGTSAQLTIKDEFRNIVIEHCFKILESAQTVSELIENG